MHTCHDNPENFNLLSGFRISAHIISSISFCKVSEHKFSPSVLESVVLVPSAYFNPIFQPLNGISSI